MDSHRRLRVEALEERCLLTVGPHMLADLVPGPDGSFPLQNFVRAPSGIFFTALNPNSQTTLYTTDGTETGTVAVKSFDGKVLSGPVAASSGLVFFEVGSGSIGSTQTIWKSDGTPQGTLPVATFNNPEGSYATYHLCAVGNGAFFVGYDTAHGAELWKTDGTAAGTAMVRDIWPGPYASCMQNMIAFQGELVFEAADGNGTELWKSDGTEAGTVAVENFGRNVPWHFADFHGTLAFTVTDMTNGCELWTSDGTSAGTAPVLGSDGQPLRFGFPESLTVVNQTLFFDNLGTELWETDLTPEGTFRVCTLDASQRLEKLIGTDNRLYLVIGWSGLGDTLWAVDESGSTITRVGALSPNGTETLWALPTACGDTLYFQGTDEAHGNEPWIAPGILSQTPKEPPATPGLYDPQSGQLFVRNSNDGGFADQVLSTRVVVAGQETLVDDVWGRDVGYLAGLDVGGSDVWLEAHRDPAGQIPGVSAVLPKAADAVPIVGDWQGDGSRGPGYYDPQSSTFHLFVAGASPGSKRELVVPFGVPGAGWTPVVGDWDGNGSCTVGLYDPGSSTFLIRNANSMGYADAAIGFGVPGAGWLPMAGDWDGDGRDSVGLYDPAGSQFYLRNGNATGMADLCYGYGAPGAGWLPVMRNWQSVSAAPELQPDLAATPTAAELQALKDAAIARWASAGLGAAKLDLMRQTAIGTADLPGPQLGQFAGGHITIDVDAAGHGWFTDPTPQPGEALGTPIVLPGAEGTDLLTVVAHELGHAVGLQDLSSSAGLMDASLGSGVRCLPTAAAADAVFASAQQ